MMKKDAITPSHSVRPWVLSGLFLALALILPFFTGQLKPIGNALCPMHLPVLLCGFFCGPVLGAVVGALAPLLRFVLFGMPVLMPSGIAMCFELATYGGVAGLLYRKLPDQKRCILIALIGAMIAGRLVWGIVQVILLGFGQSEFGWAAFISGAFLNAIPGIIIQMLLIPALVISLDKKNRTS